MAQVCRELSCVLSSGVHRQSQGDFSGSASPVREANHPRRSHSQACLVRMVTLPSLSPGTRVQHSPACTQIKAPAQGMQMQTSAFQESQQTFPRVSVKGGAQWHGQEAQMESQTQQRLSFPVWGEQLIISPWFSIFIMKTIVLPLLQVCFGGSKNWEMWLFCIL